MWPQPVATLHLLINYWLCKHPTVALAHSFMEMHDTIYVSGWENCESTVADSGKCKNFALSCTCMCTAICVYYNYTSTLYN